MTRRAVNPGQRVLFAEQDAAEHEAPTDAAQPGTGSPAAHEAAGNRNDFVPEPHDRGGADRAQEEGAAGPPADTCKLTIADLTGAWPIAELCESCGKLHGGDCLFPVTELPAGLVAGDGDYDDDDSELTPLGLIVWDVLNYLARRGWLETDDGIPDWLVADLAALAQEKPCGPLCRTTTPDGFLYPSDVADHFMTRRQEDWERWLPVWACVCGRRYKVVPGYPRAAFHVAAPDGLLGDLAGYVTPDAKRRAVKDSDACPGCGRLFADTIAGRPVTPLAKQPKPPAEPPPTLF